jgi:O-antigen ligase
MTGLLVLVLLAVLVVTFMMMRRHPVLVPALVIFVMVFAAVFVGLSDGIGPLLKTIGRDSTFTGRIDLWESAALVIQKSPWVGHGYGTAWVTENQENVSTDVSRFSKWDAPDSHNGFLNLALDLGLLGLAVFAVGYMVAVRRAFVFLHATETIEEMWPILFLAFCLLTNITEGALIKNNTIDCLLYITTVLSLARKTETFEIREMLVSI